MNLQRPGPRLTPRTRRRKPNPRRPVSMEAPNPPAPPVQQQRSIPHPALRHLPKRLRGRPRAALIEAPPKHQRNPSRQIPIVLPPRIRHRQQRPLCRFQQCRNPVSMHSALALVKQIRLLREPRFRKSNRGQKQRTAARKTGRQRHVHVPDYPAPAKSWALRHFSFAVLVLLRVALPVEFPETFQNPRTTLLFELPERFD